MNKSAIVALVVVIGAFIIFQLNFNHAVDEADNKSVTQKQLSVSPQITKPNSSPSPAVRTILTPLTIDHCITALGEHKHSEFLKMLYIAKVRHWLQTQNQQIKDKQQLYQLATSVGIKPFEFDTYLPQPKTTFNDKQLIKSLTMSEILAILNYVNNQQFSELAAQMRMGVISQSGHIMTEPLFTTIVENAPNITIDDVSLLLDVGLVINEADLKYLTKTANNYDLIRLVHQHSGIEQPTAWPTQYGSSNLNILAIESLNPISLSYWLEHLTTDFIPQSFLLDYLPVPAGQTQISQAIELVKILLANGHDNISTRAFEDIKSWLPEPLLAQLNKHDASVAGVDRQHAEFSSQLNTLNQDILAAKALEQRCQTAHDLNRATDKHLNQDLQGKMQLSNISTADVKTVGRQKFFANLKTLSAADQQQATGQTILFRAVFQSIQTGRWDQALATVERLIEQDTSDESQQDTGYYDFLLSLAVSQDAPAAFIQQLFDKGAKLADNVILSLAMGNKIAMAEQLLNHGLNLHYVDDNGKNAVSQSVLSSHRKMFEFLTRHQVALESQTGQFDPLNYALQRIGKSLAAVAFVEQLIILGKQVDESHKQQLELIRIEYPNIYHQLEALIL